MATRIISLNHPSVRIERLYGREAIIETFDGTRKTGKLEPSPLGGFLPAVRFADCTWMRADFRITLVEPDTA